ncbi:MAG TPA: polysaccharide deacetylase family protein [Armatimonadota bacterium]|nr:polysaccharide deacetylase family protein [Armatimonadota bacterium]
MSLRGQKPATKPALVQLPIIAAGRTPEIAALMYHDVLPVKQVWFDTTLADFDRQMQAIHDRDRQVISVMQLWRHLTQGTPVPPHPVVLTFDDANEGQFLYALPVLRKFHYHATFFIHTGYVGVTTSKAHMTWEQLRQAEATGLVDVEGRTVTHPCNMPDLSPAQLDRELRGGIAAVQKHLGHPSLFFSYPCGHYNAKDEAAVRRAGFLLAFDEDRGFANRSISIFAVNRFAPKRFDEAVPPAARR